MKNNTPPPTPRLISSKAAAVYLAISERKLWDITKDQRIAVVKFDRIVRYDVNDLNAFIAAAKGGDAYEN